MEKQVWVITGTSKGIGRGLANYFCNGDRIVVGCSRSAGTIDLPNYFHSQVDVTDERSVQKWIREVKKQHGRIDVLVNNIGLVKSALFAALTPGSIFNEFVSTNLASTFYTCREVSKVMAGQRKGRIINISSIMTSIHEPGTSVYSATKAAVNEFSKVIARELASAGVTCNVIASSVVLTEAAKALGDVWMQNMLKLQTIQRPIEVEEICGVIDFLSSDRAGIITGQVIELCHV